MKGSIAALGLVAGVAQANPFQGRHWQFRRDNTTVPGDTQTTLTVITTDIATITSCAPTVTDCPADESDIATLPESEKTTVVVTNTVALTTTVCPVSEVPEISASIISNTDIEGTTLTEPPPVPTGGLPTGTGVPPPVDATSSALVPEQPGNEDPDEPQPSLSTTVSDVTEDITATITQGTGSETTVKTTTIQTTYETTVVVTCTPTPGEPGSPEGPTDGPEGPTDEPTTTTTATSTGTTTMTVPAVSETEDAKTPGTGNGDDEDVEDNGTPGDNEGDDGECVCPSAVTVTAPASTVFVTIGGDGPAPTSVISDASAPEPTGDGGETGNGGDDGAEDDDEEDCEEIPEDDEDEDEDDEDADECEADETVTSTVSVPYPTGNGTIPTSGIPAPTGFARRLR